MANYIMIRDGNRKDNGCPGYIKYTEPDGRLVVQIYASTDMDSLGTQHFLDPDQVVSITRPVFQRMLNECSKARRDAHDYMQKDGEFTAALYRQFQFMPKEIIYNDAATIVYWTDGTKTVVKCNENDEYSEYAGFVAAVAKKMYGGANAINRLIDSKKVVRGNSLRQPFRPKTTLEEIFDNALKNVTGLSKFAPDPLAPLIRPDLYPHIHDSARNSSPFMEGDDPIRDENG